MYKFICLFLLYLSVSGCDSDVSIDASSQDSFKSSVSEMRNQLEQKDLELFDEAFDMLLSANYSTMLNNNIHLALVPSEGNVGIDDKMIAEALLNSFDGLSSDELIRKVGPLFVKQAKSKVEDARISLAKTTESVKEYEALIKSLSDELPRLRENIGPLKHKLDQARAAHELAQKKKVSEILYEVVILKNTVELSLSNTGEFDITDIFYDVDVHSNGKRELGHIGSGYSCTFVREELSILKAYKTLKVSHPIDDAMCDSLKRFRSKWDKTIMDNAFGTKVVDQYETVSWDDLRREISVADQEFKDVRNDHRYTEEKIESIQRKIDGYTRTLDGRKSKIAKIEKVIQDQLRIIEIKGGGEEAG